MSWIYQQKSPSRTGCNSMLQTSDLAAVSKSTARVRKVSFSVKMIWHAYMQLLQFPETHAGSPELRSGRLPHKQLSCFENLRVTAKHGSSYSWWLHCDNTSVAAQSSDFLVWGLVHPGEASNSTCLFNSQFLLLRQHAGLLFLHRTPGTRKRAGIHSPTSATIKLPLSQQLPVQQLSLSDSIYHGLLDGSAGFRHPPFHLLVSIPSLTYIVLSAQAQLIT